MTFARVLLLDNYYTDEDSRNNNVAKSGMKTMSRGGEQGDWMKCGAA